MLFHYSIRSELAMFGFPVQRGYGYGGYGAYRFGGSPYGAGFGFVRQRYPPRSAVYHSPAQPAVGGEFVQTRGWISSVIRCCHSLLSGNVVWPENASTVVRGAVDASPGIFPYSFERKDGTKETIQIERR